MADFDEFDGLGDDVLLSLDFDNLVSPIAKKKAKTVMPSTPALSAKPSCSTEDPTPEAPVRASKSAATKQISLHKGIERQACMV